VRRPPIHLSEIKGEGGKEGERVKTGRNKECRKRLGRGRKG